MWAQPESRRVETTVAVTTDPLMEYRRYRELLPTLTPPDLQSSISSDFDCRRGTCYWGGLTTTYVVAVPLKRGSYQVEPH